MTTYLFSHSEMFCLIEKRNTSSENIPFMAASCFFFVISRYMVLNATSGRRNTSRAVYPSQQLEFHFFSTSELESSAFDFYPEFRKRKNGWRDQEDTPKREDDTPSHWAVYCVISYLYHHWKRIDGLLYF